MRKIWDSQNREPLYVINESALHKRIQSKRNRASRVSDTNEIGLMVITTVTSIILITIERDSAYSYLSAAAMFLVGVYILIGRIKRKKRVQQFDRSILGDIDQAIANVSSEIKRARTFFWWMIAPVSIPIVMNFVSAEIPIWKWIVIPLAMGFALYITRWEMRRCHIPRKQELETLRAKLLEEPSETK